MPRVLVAPLGQHAPIAASLELFLAPTTAAPARARVAVAGWLADAPQKRLLLDTAALLVSELVTNSVRHARVADGQPLRLRGRRRGTTVRLELWDGGTQGTVAPRSPRRRDDIGGLGLELVARLSGAWGVDRDVHGTTVWVELSTATAATA